MFIYESQPKSIKFKDRYVGQLRDRNIRHLQ